MFASFEPGGPHANRTYFFAALLIACGLLAYISSFWGVFLLDDDHAILGDRSIRSFPAFFADLAEKPYRGRPLLRFSFAINYVLGGTNVAGYHAVNLAIHVMAGLVLFGLLRRTPLAAAGGQPAQLSEPLAFFIALLWLVHPLQTQSVTYIVQRGEALMGLFYLLTLYGVIRGAGAIGRNRTGWYVAGAICCGMGMASKEVMITAPLVVLLYDRIFLAASFTDVFRQRWPLYLTWAISGGVLVVVFVLASLKAGGHGSVGFSMSTITAWEYARSQPGVVLYYLRLVFWPHPLCLDYAWPVAITFVQTVVPTVVILGLLAATGWALWRYPKNGFWGAWFFLILAPTSSFIPVADLAVEHRMYLPSAGVLVLAVTGAHAILERLGRHMVWTRAALHARMLSVAVGVAMLLVLLTNFRNVDYSSDLAMWNNVVRQRPENYRAHMSLATAYHRIGEKDLAEASIKEAILLRPELLDAHLAYIRLLIEKGEPFFPTAREYVRTTLLSSPERSPSCMPMLGRILLDLGYVDEAADHLRESLRVEPWNVDALMNLGAALAQQGKWAETEGCFQEAATHEPENATLYLRWGTVLLRHNRPSEALPRFRIAQKLAPDSLPVVVMLAETLHQLGHTTEAEQCRDKVRSLAAR